MFSFVNIPQDLPCLRKLHDFPTKKIHLYFCDVFVLQKSLGKEATAHRDWHYALLACSPQETGTFQVRMQAVEGAFGATHLVKFALGVLPCIGQRRITVYFGLW